MAPATMVRTKRSWPGTSTTLRRAPDGSSSSAKPSSIVMPRSFSSRRRSVSLPVSARDQRGLAVVDVAGGTEGQRRTLAKRCAFGARLDGSCAVLLRGPAGKLTFGSFSSAAGHGRLR